MTDFERRKSRELAKLTDTQIIAGRAALERKRDRDEHELLVMVWLVDEFDRRHPELQDAIGSFYSDEAVAALGIVEASEAMELALRGETPLHLGVYR